MFRTKSAGLTSRCWCDLFIYILSFFLLANIVTRLYKRDRFLQHKWHIFLKRRQSMRRGETEATFQLTLRLTAKNIKSTKGETSNDVMSEYVHAWVLLTFQTCDPCTSLDDIFFSFFVLSSQSVLFQSQLTGTVVALPLFLCRDQIPISRIFTEEGKKKLLNTSLKARGVGLFC